MNEILNFWREEEGIGVVEIILILVILIGLAVVFKKEITTIVNNALKSIKDDSKTIIG
jgi:Flp pilus assembly pilin Flp